MSESEMTRRRVLQISGMLLAAGPLLAACSGGDGGSPSTAPSAGKLLGPADAPYANLYPKLPRGGAMEVGLLGSSASGLVSLDLLTSTFTGSLWAIGPVHDYLEVYDESSKLVPSLAQSVKQVDDTTVEYKLREGLTFHDKSPVNAQAVKDTLDFCLDANNKSLWRNLILGITVTKVDDLTVSIKSKEPNATLRPTLAQLPIIPVATAAKQATAPIGAGPYVFKEWVQDSYISFEPFKEYWNPDAPRLDSLKINLVADANAGLQGMMAGNMQCIFPAAVSSMKQLKTASDAGQMTIFTTPAALQLGINNLKAPFDKPDVRKALRLAIDKKTVVKNVYFDFSDPLVSIGVPPDSEFYPTDLAFDQDLATAKSLISAAGLTGTAVKLLSPNSDAYPAASAIIQQNLNDIGLKVEIETTDFATVVARMFTSHDYEIGLIALGMEADPSGRIDRYLLSDGASNLAQYKNPAVDKLLAQGRAELDPAKRKPIYEQALKIALIDDTALVPICTDVHIAVSPGKNPFLKQYGPWPNNMYHWPIVVDHT